MRTLILAALLAAGSACAGDRLMKDAAGNELRLYDTPCVNGETLAQLNEVWRDKFHAAKILDKKGHIVFFGCWIQHEDDKAYVLLQDGAEMMFELSVFTDPSI